MRRILERYANRLWYQPEHPPGPAWRLLSGIHARIKRRQWDRPSAVPTVPVIVVGNLCAGGSGKTPVVAALAELLVAQGSSPAIISRGYGGRSQTRPVQVHGDSDPAAVGDEPVLLADRSGVPVWVCTHRRLALAAAVEAGADVVLSDDGLQHRALPRSYEVVVLDGQRGFGNGWLLPAGPLRQPLARLDAVDAVLVRGPCTVAGLPGEMFDLSVTALVALSSGHRQSPDALAGQSVDALCGIGNPQQFSALLASLGMQVRLRAFPDHHRYRPSDIDHWPGPVVTTAKDAVKLARLDLSRADVLVLEIEARLPQEFEQAVLAHVREFQP